MNSLYNILGLEYLGLSLSLLQKKSGGWGETLDLVVQQILTSYICESHFKCTAPQEVRSWINPTEQVRKTKQRSGPKVMVLVND